MAERRFKFLEDDDRERSRTRERGEREPITKKREPSIIGSVLSGFFDEDIGTAIETVRTDRLIPDIKHMAYNAVTDVAAMLLGEGRSYSPRSRSSLNEGRSNNAVSSDNRRIGSDGRNSSGNSGDARGFDSRDYSFYSRGEAEEVLETLRAECAEDGKVSLARFFQLTRNKIDWSDWDVGWRVLDRSNSMCRPSKGGYILILPRPVSIRNN